MDHESEVGQTGRIIFTDPLDLGGGLPKRQVGADGGGTEKVLVIMPWGIIFEHYKVVGLC